MENQNQRKLLEAQRLIRDASRLLDEVDLCESNARKSSADCLIDTLKANVNNSNLTDSDFREFVRNSLNMNPAKLDAKKS